MTYMAVPPVLPVVPPVMPVIFTADEILERRLKHAGFKEKSGGKIQQARRFKAWYGSNPVVLAAIWEDLQTTDVHLHYEVKRAMASSELSRRQGSF